MTRKKLKNLVTLILILFTYKNGNWKCSGGWVVWSASDDLSSNPVFLEKIGHPRPLCNLFSSFQTNFTIFTTKNWTSRVANYFTNRILPTHVKWFFSKNVPFMSSLLIFCWNCLLFRMKNYCLDLRIRFVLQSVELAAAIVARSSRSKPNLSLHLSIFASLLLNVH